MCFLLNNQANKRIFFKTYKHSGKKCKCGVHVLQLPKIRIMLNYVDAGKKKLYHCLEHAKQSHRVQSLKEHTQGHVHDIYD